MSILYQVIITALATSFFVLFIRQHRSQPGDVVVVYKPDQLQASVHTPILAPETIAQGMADLKHIHAVEGRVNPLIALIVCGAVQHPVTDDLTVVSVYHLARKEKILFFTQTEGVKLPHKPTVQHIGHIQTQTVNTEIVYPPADTLQKIVFDRRIVKV